MSWKVCSGTPPALALLEEASTNTEVALPRSNHVRGSTFCNHLLLTQT